MKNANPIILLLLSFGLFYTFISPQYQSVKELQTVSNEYRSVIQNISEIIETRDRLLVSFEEIPRAEVERLSKVLPNDINSVELALDLDTLASLYGISIKNVTIETGGSTNSNLPVLPENGLPFEKATVSFTFVSNYSNFVSMLSDLERSLRIMDVKLVSFKTSDAGLYEHKVVLETYWLK